MSLIGLLLALLLGLGINTGHSSSSVANAPQTICSPNQVRATLTLQGATGSLRGGIAFRNVSPLSCALTGVRVSVGRTAANAGGDVLLAPKQRATIPVVWRNWCGTKPKAFVVRIAGYPRFALRVPGAPRCDDKAAPSTLELGRIARG